MPRFARRATTILLAAAFAFAASGCSNKKSVTTETGLTQEQADDMAQQLGAMVATDLGGWLTEVQTVSDSIPLGIAVASAGRPVRIESNANFTRAGMNWFIHLNYEHAGGDTVATYDTSAVHVNALATARGTIAMPALGGNTGTILYGHESSDITVSQLSAYAGRDSALLFVGFCPLDSALTTIHAGAATRYYYVDTTTTIEYDGITLLRGAGAPAYPVSGEATIDVNFEILNGPRHLVAADKKLLADAIMVISFERTQPQTPVVTITANSATPTTVYRYRLDLKTGALTRI